MISSFYRIITGLLCIIWWSLFFGSLICFGIFVYELAPEEKKKGIITKISVVKTPVKPILVGMKKTGQKVGVLEKDPTGIEKGVKSTKNGIIILFSKTKILVKKLGVYFLDQLIVPVIISVFGYIMYNKVCVLFFAPISRRQFINEQNEQNV